MVREVDDFICVTRQRRGVASDEVLGLAHADHQRTAQASGNQHVRMLAEHNDQTVSTFQLRHG